MYNITRTDDGFEFSIAIPEGEQFAGVAVTVMRQDQYKWKVA